MKTLFLSLLFFLPIAATQQITININGVKQEISIIRCAHCGQQIDSRRDCFIIIDPYAKNGVHYLCEDCLLEYEEFYLETKDEDGE